MKLKDLLVALSRKGYLIKVYPNYHGYNYEIHKLYDGGYTGKVISLITNADENPFNIYWDNPTGIMHYKNYQDVHDLLVDGNDKGVWKASNYSRY